MDATITQHYMHRRGNIVWENEFRYLTQAGAGLMELDYVPWIKSMKMNIQKIAIHAVGCSTGNAPVMGQVWRFNIDYAKVSDPNLFNDFDNESRSGTNRRNAEKFSVGYAVLRRYAFNQTVPGLSTITVATATPLNRS